MRLEFLGIGAQKAGTTSLHEYLHTHPELFLPEAKVGGSSGRRSATRSDRCRHKLDRPGAGARVPYAMIERQSSAA